MASICLIALVISFNEVKGQKTADDLNGPDLASRVDGASASRDVSQAESTGPARKEEIKESIALPPGPINK